MKQNSLDKFIENLRSIWGPLDSKLVMESQKLMEELVRTSSSESWLQELQGDLSQGRELYRDPKHGFVLLAHSETNDLYRQPHDHGNGWVIYAVQRGEMEMGAYARIQATDSEQSKIVRRESYRVKEGEARVYLPGDIHETRCVSDSVLMLRLTSSDLKEEQKAGRMRRYQESTKG